MLLVTTSAVCIVAGALHRAASRRDVGLNAIHHLGGALRPVASYGAVPNAVLLLEGGADPNLYTASEHACGETPPFYASARCRDGVVNAAYRLSFGGLHSGMSLRC